ncbi:hypothetical protein CPB83DRAFT_845833 [Crepidotus variabilis]|uniref:Uncharacterized protein n=1 Tax=Crepidotus variabilis TaxID=179855 RepID=A0A9P6JV37_9AGAR|nr:hypothetical protein CPB83DRAFT_845833 [Crepidotus variabilis]
MGGSAFSATKAASSFPRIPPPVYQNLKTRFLTKISELYNYVGVPVEAPEKVDHGDIDFLVAFPKAPFTNLVNIPHHVVKSAIDAEFMVTMDGNRTSNYAVPIRCTEWQPFGFQVDEDKRRSDAEDNEIFYQVDVHVCESKNEWDRIMFYHSYGDLGMILGLIARNMGLKLGTSGLHLLDHPNTHYLLSTEFDDILKFLGLSKEVFDRGFNTKRQVFEWAASCKYYDPVRFKTSGQGIRKVKMDRRMYYEFVEWVRQGRGESDLSEDEDESADQLLLDVKANKAREEALLYFGKKEEYDAVVRERDGRKRLKEVFTGSVVRDWTKLGGNWKAIKLIVDEVRQRLGGEEGVLAFWEKSGIDKLREYVLEVQASLGDVAAAKRSSPTSGNGLVASVGSLTLVEASQEEQTLKQIPTVTL